MDKTKLSESDIGDKFIRPALVQGGWDSMEQIFAQYPLRAGRVVVRGNKAYRDESTVLRADYALFYKPNIPLAIVEAKKSRLSMSAGMQQAIAYAQLLDVPFSFSSNGDGFVFRDATLATGVLEQNLTLEEFPSPQELWRRYCAWKGWSDEESRVAGFDYAPHKTPRYYQLNAVNRAVEAIAAGQNRVLLVMATGTGKTYTAFQIIWRLWKSGVKKRILFLADRNILIDQTMVNDFRPFKGAMAKLSPNGKGVERINAQGQTEVEQIPLAVNKTTKKVDTAFEIYLSLYQAVTGTEEERNIYKQFSPDFFDLIVVDECHRGSAAEDSAWRDILTYFGSATQIGLTATPKETKDVSNTDYFGEPVYTYSLKQGIEDGYLAPYKVIRVDLDKDTFGWRPTAGMTDKHGHAIEDRIYTGADMNRKLVLEQRDVAVAAKITEYLKATLRQNHRLLRRHRPRRAHAPGPEQRQRRPVRHPAQIRGADHRRQHRGQAGARQLHRPRENLPGDCHHLQAHEHRSRCANLQAHRAGPGHQVDDPVQADHWPGHPPARRPGQNLVHHSRFQARHRTVCRQRL